MKLIYAVLAALVLVSMSAVAEDTTSEIEYLLSAIGSSECTFVRNGKRHTAVKAEEHLRTKYDRGRRYATSTEKFIERLASKSSITRRAYMIECPGGEPVPTGEWLTKKLEVLRERSS